jgi:AmmeMemoRadiSam system protein B/AmmeMemoRadiSam system protein A
MSIIRPPAVAGTFYPADADILRREIDGLMDAAVHSDATQKTATPKAIIVPHAGLTFSGSLAALGFATMRAFKGQIKRILILGPAHRMAFQGIALAKADGFATPLGTMRCDLLALQTALSLPQVQMLDDAHKLEHGLEIELPFIQRLFGENADIGIVPLLVSRCNPRQVGELIEKLWGGPETLIVISSDLSHFHDYDTAKRMDANTRRMIENFDAENIGSDDACGALPVAGMLLCARSRNMRIETLGMHNSGDVTDDKSRVVGYGAWALYERDAPPATKADSTEDNFAKATEDLIKAHGPTLLDLCRKSILHGIETGTPLYVSTDDVPAALAAPGASFVTLKKSGQLRGCIGSIIPHTDLATDLCENAFKAAFRDPRFAGLSNDEINDDLELSISVLSPPHPFPFTDEADLIARLTPFEDGLILSDGNRRGLFLPQVWDQLPDPKDFTSHLKRKAGLPMDYWSNTIQAQRFITRGIAGRDIAPTDFWRNA